jgi:hypothetical protein
MSFRFLLALFLLPLLVTGCFSAPRPLFQLAELPGQERTHHLRVGQQEVYAQIEGSFNPLYHGSLDVELFNNSGSDLLVSIQEKDLWLRDCEGRKVYLEDFYVAGEGRNVQTVLVSSGNSKFINFTFKIPSCLRYDISEQRLTTTASLEGMALHTRSGQTIRLVNQIIIYAKK